MHWRVALPGDNPTVTTEVLLAAIAVLVVINLILLVRSMNRIWDP